jgi:dsRNA-specific ribonuclease
MARPKVIIVTRPQQLSVLEDDDAPEATLDDLALEDELKRENPKGRLYERCQGLRIAPPEIAHGALGQGHAQRHQIEMTLLVDEWELSSGVHTAWSRKMAEQLAARELLVALEEALAEHQAARVEPSVAVSSEDRSDEDVLEVSDADVERFTQGNPKGRLYEWCAQRKIAHPKLELRTVQGAPAVRLALVTVDLASPWCRAKRRKDAEQAAAAALLLLLPEASAPAELDPRSALAAAQQRGELAAYHFEVGEHGPAHARVFTTVGHLSLKDGTEHVTSTFEGSSKKAATLRAARELVRRVYDAQRRGAS